LRGLLLEKGFNVWMDETKVDPGERWWPTIEQNIIDCAVFMVIMSPDAKESHWVEREILIAEDRKHRKPIFPVLYRGEAWFRLGNLQYEDMQAGLQATLSPEFVSSLERFAPRFSGQPAPPPLSSEPAPAPKPKPLESRPANRKLWLIGLLVMAVIGVVAAIGLIGNLQQPSASNPTDTPTTAAIVAATDEPEPAATGEIVIIEPTETSTDPPAPTIAPSDTPTETSIPTEPPIPTITPSDTATNPPPPTLDIVAAAQTVVIQQTAQAIVDSSTATAEFHTEVAILVLTESANLTNTATLWTDTPTPNLTASVEAVLAEWANGTATQAAIDATATATLWTHTPTPTHTPTATFTPSPTPYPTVTANNQWTTVAQDFDGVEMVLVPPGCFMMGSEEGESDEVPVHEICFDEPFWIDRYEVTNAQFAAFLNQGSNQSAEGVEYLDTDDEDARIQQNGTWAAETEFADHPAIEVTWYGARDFCASRNARLPTEAEWEYAARGPDALVYPWGNDFVADNVVYSGNSGGQTAAVGSRAGGVSWVGAYDMSGNVWEWVSSLYQSYPYEMGDGREDTNSTDVRVLRGGSWDFITNLLRAADRFWYSPVLTFNGFGVRCARS
jgi:formylglycine-generating enzyme required for sulfatase activity